MGPTWICHAPRSPSGHVLSQYGYVSVHGNRVLTPQTLIHPKLIFCPKRKPLRMSYFVILVWRYPKAGVRCCKTYNMSYEMDDALRKPFFFWCCVSLIGKFRPALLCSTPVKNSSWSLVPWDGYEATTSNALVYKTITTTVGRKVQCLLALFHHPLVQVVVLEKDELVDRHVPDVQREPCRNRTRHLMAFGER